MVVMPDGSVVPVAPGSGATSQQRSDVSSVERQNVTTAHTPSAATASPVVDSAQSLPPKPSGVLGLAPGSNVDPHTRYPQPHVHARPSPFTSMPPPYHTDHYTYTGEEIAPEPDQPGGTGPAPNEGEQHHSYGHPSYPLQASVQPQPISYQQMSSHQPYPLRQYQPPAATQFATPYTVYQQPATTPQTQPPAAAIPQMPVRSL